MALSAGEVLSGGVVRDSQGRTVVAVETVGAALSAGDVLSGGQVRDADGRIVIGEDTVGAVLSAGEVRSGGEVRDSQGRMVCAVDTVGAVLSAGEQVSGGQVRDSQGRRVIVVDANGAALSAGEQLSGGEIRDALGRMVMTTDGATYDQVVLADGPVSFWKLNEVSGVVAADSAGTNTGTYQAAPTLGAVGIGDGETAVTFNGTSQYVSTATSIASPGPVGPFSLECWFKTTTANGAIVFQFGNTQTGVSASFDRVVYVGTDGKVYWALDTTISINSTLAYNDGNYHHVVAVLAANNNMTLYVDGSSVASNANVTAGVSFAGFWRLADGATNAGFVNEGTVGFFNGTLAKAAIYNKVLTAVQVAAHHTAG